MKVEKTTGTGECLTRILDVMTHMSKTRLLDFCGAEGFDLREFTINASWRSTFSDYAQSDF